MRKQECFDYSRRALLGASGALALLALLQPLRIFAQAGGGNLRIGIIGSGHIGGAIGGLWVKAGHPVLFSSRHPARGPHRVCTRPRRPSSPLLPNLVFSTHKSKHSCFRIENPRFSFLASRNTSIR